MLDSLLFPNFVRIISYCRLHGTTWFELLMHHLSVFFLSKSLEGSSPHCCIHVPCDGFSQPIRNTGDKPVLQGGIQQYELATPQTLLTQSLSHFWLVAKLVQGFQGNNFKEFLGFLLFFLSLEVSGCIEFIILSWNFIKSYLYDSNIPPKTKLLMKALV